MGPATPNNTPANEIRLTLDNFEALTTPNGIVVLSKASLLQSLDEIDASDNLVALKVRLLALKNTVSHPPYRSATTPTIDVEGASVSLRGDTLLSEMDQILESYTLERAKYYLRRLRNGILNTKTTAINDINLLRWKEYDDIITDSLWVLDKRDTSGAHLGWYWGNFIPQIPHQMMLRYSKKHDWVLDTFVGSGTTLIECRRLGRHGIGIELNSEVAQRARELVEKEGNNDDVTTEVIVGDSRTVNIGSILSKHNISKIQLIIMHPPYHDIIKFSSDTKDLSNAKDTEQFLKMFGEVVDNATPFLEKGRYFALVIGDKYSKGEWIPLGFYCMNEVLRRDYLLKSIIVKNFDETRAKRKQVGGFYVLKHEYVMVFQKRE